MTDSEEVEVPKEVQYAFEFDRLVRTQILHGAISIEWWIDNIIAAHFCQKEEEYPLFFSLIFKDGEVTFSAKIRILKKLLKLRYPELSKRFPKLIDRLDNFRQVRNKFAHSGIVLPIDESSEKIADGIKLKYYKDGEEIQEDITREKADQYNQEGWQLFKELFVVMALVQHKVAGTESGQSAQSSVGEAAQQVIPALGRRHTSLDVDT